MSMLSIVATCSLCSLSLFPAEETLHDQVDLVEVNHYYDENANHIFDQVIFYDWSDEHQRFQVRAWRLIKETSQLPTRNLSTGGYGMIWNDGQFLREVHARAMRETWTQHDPEMRERTHFPKEYRRELLTPRVESQVSVP